MLDLSIRGFTGDRRIFEESIDGDPDDVAAFAINCIKRLLPYPSHTIEMEFLDDPGPPRRIRFGTDAEGVMDR